MDILQDVIYAYRHVGRHTGSSYIHLGASSMQQQDVQNKHTEKHTSGKAAGFLPATSWYICVSEHVWMSSIHGKAESFSTSPKEKKRVGGRTCSGQARYIMKAEEVRKRTRQIRQSSMSKRGLHLN